MSRTSLSLWRSELPRFELPLGFLPGFDQDTLSRIDSLKTSTSGQWRAEFDRICFTRQKIKHYSSHNLRHLAAIRFRRHDVARCDDMAVEAYQSVGYVEELSRDSIYQHVCDYRNFNETLTVW